MAVVKTARVVGSRDIGNGTRLVDLTMADEGPVGFRGGQYMIMNTGVMLPGDKACKRAYSILSADGEQHRMQIAVKRLDPGPGSAALHGAPIGKELNFSGPWGKLYPEPESEGRSLLFATDTGITAVLGLAQSVHFTRFAPRAELVWYVESDAYFVTEAFVRERLGASGVTLRIERALPAHHPERFDHARAIAMARVEANGMPGDVYLAGDGAIVHPLRDFFVARGVAEGRAKLEAFFNNPARKAP
jgi:ferredoxin-NADP reductase